MTEKPLVSVIINCYNSEKYLRETIDSLVAQTYENWEAIFWDNCSTDKTAEIITSYKEPRFRYFLAEKNTPLGEARNLAMEKVQGKYFCFLDSDDVWMENFVQQGVKILEEKNTLTAFFANYYNWKKKTKKPFNKNRKSGVYSFKYLVREYGIGMSACIIRFNIVQEKVIRFNCKYQLIEDLDFFLKIADWGDFYYSSDTLCLYRIHELRTTIQLRRRWVDEYNDYYNYLLNNYVNTPSQRLCIDDLNRIKKGILEWKLNNCIESNDRKQLFYLLKENKDIIKGRIDIIIYFVFGKRLYNIIKKLKNRLQS